MAEQFSLFGDTPAPPAKKPVRSERLRDRLLLLVYLSPPAAVQAEAIGVDVRQRYGLRGAAIKRDILHITLQDFGTYDGLPPELVAGVAKAAARVHAHPFEAAFDRLTSFGRGNGERPMPVVLWRREANNPPLVAFQHTLATALRSAALPVGGKFNPHVTLRWDRATVPEQPITPVRWAVEDFALVHSIQGEATHITLDRWALQG